MHTRVIEEIKERIKPKKKERERERHDMHGNQLKVLYEEKRIVTELSCTHVE
jgi:hypothetical protein